MAEALLAFGANLGDPVAAISAAMARLHQAGVAIRRRSSFYRTAPWGPVAQPDFVNACALAETGLVPRELLAACKAVEAALGRVPGERWGPRTLDIDILDYDGLVLEEPDLTLPHPRLTGRAFVLVPLSEITPDRVVAGRPVRDWAAGLDASGVRRIEP